MTIGRPSEGAASEPVIERFLRDRESVWFQIEADEQLSPLTRSLLFSSTASPAVSLVGGVRQRA